MANIPDKMVKDIDGYPQKLSREEIAQRYQKLIGEVDKPSIPLDLEVTDETELEGGIIQQRLEYAVEPDEIVPAYHLFRKDLPDNAPGLLSIHAHGGGDIFPVGKAYHCHPKADDPAQYSYLAALKGFRVLAPDSLCFGERQAKWGHSTLFFDEIITHEELASKGKSLAWKSIWDNNRAVEALESLGASAISAIGWSGGSIQSYILAPINEKIKAIACFFSYATLRHQFNQFRCCHCLYIYPPGMVNAGIDWDQVISLIPPRKVFLAWGAKDEGTPEPMYLAFKEAIEQRCQEDNLPSCLETCEDLNLGHDLTMPMVNQAIDFLYKNTN